MAVFAMGWHKPDNVAGSSAPAIMVGLFVASGGLLFGYDTGYVAGRDSIAGRLQNGWIADCVASVAQSTGSWQ